MGRPRKACRVLASSCAGEGLPWRHESSRSAVAWAAGPCCGPAKALLMIVCMERDCASGSPVHTEDVSGVWCYTVCGLSTNLQ